MMMMLWQATASNRFVLSLLMLLLLWLLLLLLMLFTMIWNVENSFNKGIFFLSYEYGLLFLKNFLTYFVVLVLEWFQYQPRPNCGQSGIVDHKGKNQRNDMFGTNLFCILDVLSQFSIQFVHAQIGIFHHIYRFHVQKRVCTTPSCIG